jgi:hypothetical protein
MNKLPIKFKERISQTITITEERRVVLIDVPGDDSFNADDSNHNIYCIDNDFSVIWKVAGDGIIYGVDPFVQMKLKENGLIEVRRFFGNIFELDIESGALAHTGWTK